MMHQFHLDLLKEESPKNSAMNDASTILVQRWGGHRFVALEYCLCETVAFTNVAIQTYVLDVLFRGKFAGLGLMAGSYYSSEMLSDPFRLFPVVAICSLKRYGPTGFVEQIDALCMLPINALNAKIFLWLWIWFRSLQFLSIVNLLYLVLCIICPRFRALLQKIPNFAKGCDGDLSYSKLIAEGNCGDWFILSSLQKHIDGRDFRRLNRRILDKLSSSEQKNGNDESVVIRLTSEDY